MGEFILSFDTEDLANRGLADDSVMELANILTEEGIVGCFNVVSSLLTIWRNAGRNDILEALSLHEISSHSRYHTWHPTPPEIAEENTWNDAFVWSLEQQGAAIQEIKKSFGLDDIVSYVPPGNTFSAPDISALRHLGIKIYGGSFFRETNGMGVWNGGLLHFQEKAGLDALLIREGFAGVVSRIDEWKTNPRVFLCLHPNNLVHSTFWDAENLQGSNHARWGKMKKSPLRDEALIKQVFKDFRKSIQLLKREMIPTTFRGILATQPRRPSIRRDWILDLIRQSSERLLSASRGQITWSAAEILRAAAWFLVNDKSECDTRFMDGLREEAQGVTAPLVLMPQAIRAAAWSISESTFVPSAISIDGIQIGPGDFLDAAYQVLKGKDKVMVEPRIQIPEVEGLYGLDRLNISGWMYPENWIGKKTVRQLHASMWTFRPEKQTDCSHNRDGGLCS